ncbi:Ankyrin repeat domain-containing protein 49 [Balamuthia mandrillaris]
MKGGSQGKSPCLCGHDVRSSTTPTPHRCDERGEELEGEMLAFFAAARKGDLSALLRFQEKHNGEADRGLSVSIVDGYGETALHHASFRAHYQVVEWLLEQDASLINVPSRQEGETAVHRCCRGKKEEHVRVLQLLLDKGARLDQRDKNGLTPLHRACYENNLHMIRVLLSKGADKSHPLHWASYTNGRKDVVQLLLEHGADATHKNDHGETPVDNAKKFQNEELAAFYAQHLSS